MISIIKNHKNFNKILLTFYRFINNKTLDMTKLKLNPKKNGQLINGDYELFNEVQILINDNSDTYNHNISIRITDGECKIHPEELSKIAMQRALEARQIAKNPKITKVKDLTNGEGLC